MERFGVDKPDLRFGFELVDISDIVENSEFKVFSGTIKNKGSVRGINVKGYGDKITRKNISKLELCKGFWCQRSSLDKDNRGRNNFAYC